MTINMLIAGCMLVNQYEVNSTNSEVFDISWMVDGWSVFPVNFYVA